MEFLRFLESIRTPVGDALMSFITLFGEETLFIVLALVFFWCIDKKRGFYLLFTCFAGTICIQILKMIFRIPRPWVLDPDFTIVESAREAATGYSFPSGHTQCAAGLWGGLARSAKKRWMQIAGVAMCLLVGLSRMYLGVHTPLDVFVSLGIALVLIFVLYYVVYLGFDKPRRMYIACGVLLLAAIANLLFVTLYQFPADVDPTNLANAQKTAWQMLALAIGVCMIYPLDRYWLKFETKAVWWAQLLKLGIGVGLVLAVRVLLKTPLNDLFGVNLGAAVRYFLIVLVAGILWPMTFKFWSKLGKTTHQNNDCTASTPKNGLNGQSKTTIIVICFLLGCWGVHNFMMGEKKKGFLKIVLTFCFGIGYILALIDFVKLLIGEYVVEPT